MPQCITPFNKRDENNVWQPLPCGKCKPCIDRRKNEWATRLVKEGETSSSSFFVTLTYDTKFVPLLASNVYGRIMNLDKKHVQDFIKRVRHHDLKTGLKIKYYAVGEYGGQTHRPHYHLIMYNVSADAIIKSWRFGHVHMGNVCGASVGYTLKYIEKKTQRYHPEDKRQKEFSLMSKGLGRGYLTPKIIAWHLADLENRMYFPLLGGKKSTLARYYKLRIYNSEAKGYLKGFYEKKHIQDELNARATNPDYDHDLIESHLASFRKLEKSIKEHSKI